MKILFLHGLDSRPYQDRKDLLSKYGEVVMPHMDYRNEKDVYGRIAEIAGTLTGDDIIVGHSMGGLLAYYLSNKFKIPAVMFMPAFGSSNRHFLHVPESVNELQRFANQLSVIGTKDDVVDNSATEKIFPAYLVKEEPCDHRLSPTVLDKWIRHFLSVGADEGMITSLDAFKTRLTEMQSKNKTASINESMGDISLREIAIDRFNTDMRKEIDSLFVGIGKYPQAWYVSGDTEGVYTVKDETAGKSGMSFTLTNYSLQHSHKINGANQCDTIATFTDTKDREKFINACVSYKNNPR